MTQQDSVEWCFESTPVAYPDALRAMETRVAAILAGNAHEQIWLIEHPPLYTAGTSADPAELIDPRFPVFAAGRGGRYTYHGPGQRVGYVMLNLARRGRDVRTYVHALEGWVIAALAKIGVDSWRAPGRIGIWVNDCGQEAKIGAIGVRIRHWVSFHGFSVNVDPDLNHFSGIVPCGLAEFEVTSLKKLGVQVDQNALDTALFQSLEGFLQAIEKV